MSGSLSITGGANATTGLVTVPSAFSGAATAGGGINALLQDYLNGVSSQLGGSMGLDNDDIASGGGDYTVSGTGGMLQEFTNVDSTGGVASGSVTSSYLTPYGTNLVVEAPGSETITGANTATNFALFGANSNVDYTITNPSPSTIFAAGGADSITLLDDGVDTLTAALYSAGNDTMNLWGAGNATATSDTGANDTYNIDDANATITANGNATVSVFWRNSNSGGTLDFVNNSTNAATIYSSVFNGEAAGTHVTAYGGGGGGFFVGGQGNGSLPNLLVGGAVGSVSVDSSGAITQVSANGSAGVVTLVGASSGDVLDAQSGLGQNDLFAGSGSETLLAASTTGSNLFQLGLTYFGIGQPPSDGVVSTDGSGAQSIFLGNSNGASIYGSTALGATNNYLFVGDSTTGGGVFTIENFSSANSAIYLINSTDNGAGDASVSGIVTDPFNSNNTLIGLSDGTRITLVGVNSSSVSTINGGSGITKII